MKKIIISIDNINFSIKLRKTKTADIIKNSLPLEGKCNTWGKEFYFYTNLNIDLEFNALAIIKKGEIAYWTQGDAIVIGFGKTPISIKEEIRLADKCNIWADKEFDLNILNDIVDPKLIKIEHK